VPVLRLQPVGDLQRLDVLQVAAARQLPPPAGDIEERHLADRRAGGEQLPPARQEGVERHAHAVRQAAHEHRAELRLVRLDLGHRAEPLVAVLLEECLFAAHQFPDLRVAGAVADRLEFDLHADEFAEGVAALVQPVGED
jgi:hypothetical protein